jgi:hypothetical protein
VELPEFFEDNMSHWMYYFKLILELKDKLESLRECKTHIIKNITLYCEKYASDFKDYVCPFYQLIWDQIDQATMEAEYDKVKFIRILLILVCLQHT